MSKNWSLTLVTSFLVNIFKLAKSAPRSIWSSIIALVNIFKLDNLTSGLVSVL